MRALLDQIGEVAGYVFTCIPFRDVICLIFLMLTLAFVIRALCSKGLSRDTRRWWQYFLVVTVLFFASEVFRTGRLLLDPNGTGRSLFYLLSYGTLSLGCVMLLLLIFWSHRRLNIFQ